MAIRRRVGVSSAESARRQLMQPVTLWEKAWVPTENSAIKVYTWVRTDKVQHFGEDEGTVDEPLVPLPDEPEVVEGDEEEQDENAAVPESEQPVVDAIATQEQQDEELEPEASKPSSPKLSMTLQQTSALDDGVDTDNLDPSLHPDKLTADGDDNDGGGAGVGVGIGLDIDPEAMQMDTTADLSQLDETALMDAAALLNDSVDPFVGQ